MISREELLAIARLNNLRPWQQERHYVQALILNSLAEQRLVFKGGTYLWFFHGLRRFSEDLDFTALGEPQGDLPDKVSSDLELFGVENKPNVVQNNDKTLSFRISAAGPLNTSEKDRCFVYVEISKREAIVKRPIPLRFDHAEYQLPIKSIMGMSLEEVGAEKVRAILTRDKARDIYDLHTLITKKGIKFDRNLVDNKLAYYGLAFSKTSFISKVKVRREAYGKELKGIVLEELPEFKDVVVAIGEWLESR